MKTTLTFWILGLLLLGLSCKKPVEIETEPPLPPEGCRIVRTYYKTPTTIRAKNDIIDSETVKLDDGTKIEVSLVSITTYKYDQQGRIVDVLDKSPSGSYFSERYVYDDKRFVRREETYTSSGNSKPYSKIDTIWLNEQGLRTYINQSGQPLFVYNNDRQLISTFVGRPNTLKYEAGNVIEAIFNPNWIQENGNWTPTDFQLRHYTYTNRPNLPVIHQYTGNGSRNLPIKEVWEMKRSSQFPDGPVYQKIFTYTFDGRGLVKRRITHGKPLNSGWLIEDDLYGVGVTDFEYECP